MPRMRCPAAISPSRIVAANSGVPMKTRSRPAVVTAAAPTLLRSAGRRRSRARLCRREGAGAFRLCQLAQNDAAFQRRDVVDEQDAVQMVDFVLQNGREQPLGLEFANFV